MRTHRWRRFSSRDPSRAARLDRIISRLPRPLQKYTNRLRDAPLSHVVSFLILHECTAIIPLFGLVGVFHYTNFVPVSYITEHFGEYVQSGVARFERYFTRKGWFGFGQDKQGTSAPTARDAEDARVHTEEVMERWNGGEAKYKILGEVALAYAVTKALLPVRIIGSVWATPWFARILVGARKALFRRP